jgi:hypothetical protein
MRPVSAISLCALALAGCGGSQSSTATKPPPTAERTKQIQDCMGAEGLTTRPRGQLSGSTSAFEASDGGQVVSYVFVFDSPENASAAQKAIFAELDPRGAVAARTVRGVVVANTIAAADHQPAIDDCVE